MQSLEQEIKELIISSLALEDITPDDIDRLLAAFSIATFPFTSRPELAI